MTDDLGAILSSINREAGPRPGAKPMISVLFCGSRAPRRYAQTGSKALGGGLWISTDDQRAGPMKSVRIADDVGSRVYR
jgi:hypothetical protein